MKTAPDESPATEATDLEGVVASLTEPATKLLSSLAAGATRVLRAMLDEAYARGRADEAATIHQRVSNIMFDDIPQRPLPPELRARSSRRSGGRMPG